MIFLTIAHGTQSQAKTVSTNSALRVWVKSGGQTAHTKNKFGFTLLLNAEKSLSMKFQLQTCSTCAISRVSSKNNIFLLARGCCSVCVYQFWWNHLQSEWHFHVKTPLKDKYLSNLSIADHCCFSRFFFTSWIQTQKKFYVYLHFTHSKDL